MVQAPKAPSISRRRGSVAIEYAIILPVLLLFLLGIMDVGRLLWTYSTLHRASDSAARWCAIQPTTSCVTNGATQNFAVAEAWGLIIATSAFTVSNPACGVQVVANFSFVFVIPWLSVVQPFGSSNSIPLTATACYPS
jgi:Flp pilus assembly protein TadG